MIANREEGVTPKSADHFFPRLAARTQWNAFDPDDLLAAQERTRTWLSARQHADGHWVGELEGDTILESESILLLAFLGRESESICDRMPVHPGPPAPRGRLGDLSRRAGRGQRVGQGVLRPEARRAYSTDDPAMVRGPRGDPRRRAAPGLQQLHAVLPGAARPDRLRRVPERPAGAGADPVAAELQPDRDVGLDADDRRAAVDHVGLQAGPAGCRRSGDRRAVPRTTCRAARRGGRPGSSPGRTSSWASTGC